MTRTEKTMRNVRLSLICQFIVLLTSVITRRFISDYTSIEYLSVGGLFSNIMTVLSLAELGIGTSITFSLYKPISDGDESKIRALMRLFKNAYTVIGIAVLVLGGALLPALHLFVDDIDAVLAQVPDFYLIYILYVVNSAASYIAAYKRILIIADQKKYIASAVTALSKTLLCVASCVVLALTGNYVIFMICTVVATLGENIALSLIADKKYSYLKEKGDDVLSADDKKTIKTNVGASMMHNVGGVLVNGTDNIIISRFVSFLTEGIYTNYHLLSAAVDSVLAPIFQSATASFGDLSVNVDNAHKRSVFHRMFFAGAWLYGFCAICLAVLARPFVLIWLGEGFEIDDLSVFLVALNFYLLGMRRPGLVARDAMGLMRYDKWKSIAEAAINIVLSIILAKYLGLAGVLLGTTASSLLTCTWVEPYMLYKHGFKSGVGSFFIRYGVYTAVTAVALGATVILADLVTTGGILGLAIKLLICLTVPNIIYAVAYFKTDEFKYFYMSFLKKFSNKS